MNGWFVPALLVRCLLYLIVRLVYSITPMGRDKVPREGPVLLVANHISYVDVPLLQFAYPRYIHFVAHEYLFRIWWLGWMLRMMGTVEIAPQRPRRALQQVLAKLKEGKVVCMFPEGGVTRTGCLNRIKPGIKMIAEQADCPIQPAFIDGIWGSIFTFQGSRFLGKKPLAYRHPIRVNLGPLLQPEEDLLAKVRRSLLDLGEEAFSMRPCLDGHLGHRALCALSRRPWKRQLVDTFPERRELSRGKLLGAAIAYSRHLRATVPDKRVGVVLPPGAGGALANLAIVLAGKIPVNLNFTAGRTATEASYRRGEIRTVITASALEQRLNDFPWPENKLDLPRELKALDKKRILAWVALAHLLPGGLLAGWIGIPRRGGREEAALLFTSGSSGEPKGVALTHRNLLANMEQISSVNLLLPADSFLASLPLFHSFGFTVTFWYPILEGIPIVTVPSPLEVGKIADAVRAERPTALFGTPTFLRPYVKKIEPEDFSSLRLGVAGAEKLPVDLREAFQEKFGVPILEGYGLTETAPVASANMPNPPPLSDGTQPEGERLGSVGRLLPGMTARIVSAEDGQTRPEGEKGVLWLKGPNVFPGYLRDEEKTAEAFSDGWYITGDVARFDDDGFLFIEGRLSRFSKLGGEMVPHGTVEEKIRETMNLSLDQAEVVVMGIMDEKQREHLVALSSIELDRAEMVKRLRGTGLPNLWIPERVFQVEEIPVLGSGKLDLKNCQRLANEKWKAAGGGPA